MPLASVQIERTDSLELLPVAKAETKRYGHIGHPSYTYLQYIYISIYRSPTHATIIGTLDPVDGRTVAKLSQVRRLLYFRVWFMLLQHSAISAAPVVCPFTTMTS